MFADDSITADYTKVSSTSVYFLDILMPGVITVVKNISS
jgi:hypothetical protein